MLKKKSKTEVRKLVVPYVFVIWKVYFNPHLTPEKLPTYPSLKLTLTLTSHLGKNVGLREG